MVLLHTGKAWFFCSASTPTYTHTTLYWMLVICVCGNLLTFIFHDFLSNLRDCGDNSRLHTSQIPNTEQNRDENSVWEQTEWAHFFFSAAVLCGHPTKSRFYSHMLAVELLWNPFYSGWISRRWEFCTPSPPSSPPRRLNGTGKGWFCLQITTHDTCRLSTKLLRIWEFHKY